MDSLIGLPRFGEPFGSRFHSETLGNREGHANMDEYLNPHLELETLKVYMCMYVMDKSRRDGLPHHQNSMSFSALGSILKKFWEPTSVNVRVILLVEGDTTGECLHPYIELRTLRVYTRMYTMVTDSFTRR
jgi:hypothetical protein